MEKRITVLVGDDSVDFGQICSKTLSSQGLWVKNTAKDGNEVLKQIKSDLPDVVIMDAYMKNLDAISIMEEVNLWEAYKPAFIVVSFFDDEFVQKEAKRLGAMAFMMKPFDLHELANRITAAFNDKQESTETMQHSLEAQIVDILLQTGMPTNIKGYRYVREGIQLAVTDPHIMDSITRKLYPAIAEKFGTTSFRVERGIRYAIEKTWALGDMDALNDYFSCTIRSLRKPPSNSLFIATIADLLSLHNKNKKSK